MRAKIVIPPNYNIFDPNSFSPPISNTQGEEEEEEEEFEEEEEAEEEEEEEQVEAQHDDDTMPTQLPGIPNIQQRGELNEINQIANDISREDRIIMKYAPLDSDRKRRLKKLMDYEAAGIDETTKCQLCRLATEELHNDQGSSVMASIYNYEKAYYLNEPDGEIFSKIADKFNKEVYGHDIMYSGRNGIKKLTPAEVSWHFDHSPRNFKRVLVEDLLFLNDVSEEMRQSQIFYREEKNGLVVSEQYMDEKKMDQYLKIDAAKEKKIRLIKDILDNEENEGGHKKRRKSSPAQNPNGGTQLKVWFGPKNK